MIPYTKKQYVKAITTTMNFKKGNGFVEAFFATALLLIAVVAMFFEAQPVPQWITGAIGVILGFYFRDKVQEHGQI